MGERRLGGWLACALALGLLAPASAAAFCGFYVSGAEREVFAEATMVVMMREDTTTVLSMQNSYSGPPERFAMVVPVPVVLQKENVKTLEDALFEKVDRLASPRLVEYWEQDPCSKREGTIGLGNLGTIGRGAGGGGSGYGRGAGGFVEVEAEFAVGEYEIVVLSSNDSSTLDRWLREHDYHIPEGAEPYLRPYVEQGMKFFVAKVDPEKVEFERTESGEERAVLSPLRFHYDAEEFSLPVRLGLINSSGTQDLIVHILARGKRYEVANYDNVTIPTNIVVADGVRERFGAFYAALFDRTVERNPGAVVTEYAWDAGTCDPCPGPSLDRGDLATLGADVLDAQQDRPFGGIYGRRSSFVLTRLHYRYDEDGLTDDLVFRPAGAIQGGRGTPSPDGELLQGVGGSYANQFQGRYAILHRWDGEVGCDEPHRGLWGGKPASLEREVEPVAATDIAFAPRGQVELASLVTQPLPALGLAAPAAAGAAGEAKEAAEEPSTASAQEKASTGEGGCGCVATAGRSAGGASLAALVLLGLFWRRSSSRRRSASPLATARGRCAGRPRRG